MRKYSLDDPKKNPLYFFNSQKMKHNNRRTIQLWSRNRGTESRINQRKPKHAAILVEWSTESQKTEYNTHVRKTRSRGPKEYVLESEMCRLGLADRRSA